jgi:hypothetical protein
MRERKKGRKRNRYWGGKREGGQIKNRRNKEREMKKEREQERERKKGEERKERSM